MKVTGAVIKQGNVRFAVVVVKPHALHDHHQANRLISGFAPAFGAPVVLMAQDSRGRPTYYGRTDIARFMSGMPTHAIPWREYSIN